MEHVGRLWMTPASSTERVDYFLAPYSETDRVDCGGGLEQEHEQIRLREVPLSELWALAEAGRLNDAKTLILVQALRIRRPELFGAPAQTSPA
jgi:hypothetical protein